jgi:effector-binding domain-containing protein
MRSIGFALLIALCIHCAGGETKVNIELKDMKKQSTLVVKKTIKQSEIAAALGEIFGKVFPHFQLKKITPVNLAPMARYSKSAKEGMLDIEGGVIVPEGTKGEGEIVPSELPGGKVAFVVHTGPYSDLPKTYEAVKAALAEKGLKDGNISWEIYISDPGNTKPEELKTEVYITTEPKK